MPLQRSALDRAFRPLWIANTSSVVGSAVAQGVLPLMVITLLGGNAGQVALLATAGAVVGAIFALGCGRIFLRYSVVHVLTWTQFIRGWSLVTLATAVLIDMLSFWHLLICAVIQTSCGILYSSALNVHLKATLPRDDLLKANVRIETTMWTCFSLGPPLGGVVVSALGPVVTVVWDSISFMVSGALFRRLPKTRLSDEVSSVGNVGVRTGFRVMWSDVVLRNFFVNSLLNGGAFLAAGPIMAFLMLHDLQMSPWQYGVVTGIPCFAGLLGSCAAQPLAQRLPTRGLLLVSGALRVPWFFVMPFLAPGLWGFVALCSVECFTLFSAGIFNPLFATMRLERTPLAVLPSVTAAWSSASKVFQPVCIAMIGGLAAATSTRLALFTLGGIALAGAFAFPWRRRAWDTVAELPQVEPAPVRVKVGV